VVALITSSSWGRIIWVLYLTIKSNDSVGMINGF